MRNIFNIFLLISIVCISTQNVYAQKNSSTQKKEIVLPKVKTFLGDYENNSAVNKEEGAYLITLPLRIVDDKGKEYPIDGYQFLYKKKGKLENEETGKEQTIYTTPSARFTKTPLPKVWIDNIQLNLQSGEEFYFFDVLVKDSKGNIFFAPNLKITIQ